MGTMTIACLNTDQTLFEAFKAAIECSFTQYSVLVCADIHQLRLHHPLVQPEIVIQSIPERKNFKGHSQLTKIRHAFTHPRIVVLDFRQHPGSPAAYFRSGVLGYLVAGDGPCELVECIDAALKNRRFIGNIAALRLLKDLKPGGLR